MSEAKSRVIYLRRHIMIKGRFVEALMNGVKRATIRLGHVVPRYREVIIHGGGRPVAKAVITNVIYKKVRDLTDEDAKKDGYNSVKELIEDLERIYNRKISPDEEVTIIEFEVTAVLNQLKDDDVYLGLSPVDIAALARRYLWSALNENERKIIDSVLRYRSIRETSIKLFGSLNKRWIVRRVLRKCLRELVERKLIRVQHGLGDEEVKQ